ncbi:MAG: hypothetical protein HY923_07990 [Elusimicrobia bacterium]|nr:hypothetical protein [Elusimicrobiota bacterium]
MSVSLSPMAPRYAVSDADDPFKKYWWAILLGIGFTALWLLMPMLGEKSIGSNSYTPDKPKVDANVEQSLSAADAGNGIDLSMDGTGHKRKEDGAMTSGLFFPADETPAAGTLNAAPLGSAAAGSGSTLAGALKKVSEGGGWGEKAQKGFNAPKLAGGSLSGMGAASGGSAGSASGGSGAFGSSNAKIGFGGAKGVSGNVKDQAAPGTVAALKATAGAALEAARNGSNDGARAGMSGIFDGGKAGGKIAGGGAALSGGYAALDAAPVNLKLDDPKLNSKELKVPEAVDDGASSADDADLAAQLGQQMAMQIIGGVIGAAIGGPVGGIVSNAIMKAVENSQKRTEEKQKEQMDRQAGISPTGK